MSAFYQAVHRWRNNPIVLKELRGRMRGRRAFVVLSIYLSVMAGLVGLVYTSLYYSTGALSNPNMADAGKTIFSMVLVVQGFLVFFIGPIFTTGAITGEKERQTYELLRTTLLSAPALLLGKLASGLAYILLLIIASIPMQSIAFLLGGISFTDLALTQAVILTCALTYAMLGLYCSTITRGTISATVITLSAVLLSLIGLPLLFILADIFNFPYYRLLPHNGDLLMASANVIGSLANIMSGHAIFGSLLPTALFMGLYGGLTLILFALALRRLRRTADR